jgi:DNA primase
MSTVDDIKARLDIVSYISQYVTLRKSGRYYKALCPFHTEDTPSFIVNEERQTWRCFGACAEGGDIFSFAQRFHNWTFVEALQSLAQQAGIEVHHHHHPQGREQTRRLRELLMAAARYYHKALVEWRGGSEVRDYVTIGRGLTPETIGDFQLGYAPPSASMMTDRLLREGFSEQEIIAAGIAVKSSAGQLRDFFHHRLLIPIKDEYGVVVGFGARALTDDQKPKYLNSPQSALFDKSHLLYGLSRAGNAIRSTGVAVVVEGYVDVLAAHQADFTNTVAQMGTALHEQQAQLLIKSGAHSLVLALDGDAAGQEATWRGVMRLAGKVEIGVVPLPDGLDPDKVIRDRGADVWSAWTEQPIPAPLYLITAACNRAADTTRERERVARQLLPVLTACESDLVRRDNLQRLGHRLRIPVETLLVWAAEPGQEARGQQRAVQIVTEPARSPLERAVLGALLRQEGLYYEAARALRLLAGADTTLLDYGLDAPSADDFPDHRHIAAAFVEALEQFDMDYLDYCKGVVGEAEVEALVRLETVVETPDDFLRLVCRLRLKRLSIDIDMLLLDETDRAEEGDLGAAYFNQSKARLLHRLRKLDETDRK